MTSAPQEPCSERLHVMVRPTTKAQLKTAFRRNERFNSEADIVRHLLETYLPVLLNERPRRSRLSEADVTTADEPAGPRIGSGRRLPQIRRDDVAPPRDLAADLLAELQLATAHRHSEPRDGYPDDSPQLPPSAWLADPSGAPE